MSQYFNNMNQGQSGSRQIISPGYIQQQAPQQGPGIMDLIGGALSIMSGFGVGGAALAGANNALSVLSGGGGTGAAAQSSDDAGTQSKSTKKSNGNASFVGDEEPGDAEKRLKPEPVEQNNIDVEPVQGPTPTTVFDPNGLAGGQQNLILQLLMSGLLGGPNQAPQQPTVPYSSGTGFKKEK